MLRETAHLSKTCSAAFKVIPTSQLRGPGPHSLLTFQDFRCRKGRPDTRDDAWQPHAWQPHAQVRSLQLRQRRTPSRSQLYIGRQAWGTVRGLLGARPMVGREGWQQALPTPCRPAGNSSRDRPPGRVRHTEALQRRTELERRCELHEGERRLHLQA